MPVAVRRALLLLLSALVCAALIALARQAADAPATSDMAVIESYTLLASRAELLLGAYSRFQWHHPGPLYFYLLAPFYALSGEKTAGLDAGADDLPVDDAALFARVRSLVRLKMMTDELCMRESTGQGMGLIDPAETLTENNHSGRILVIEDRTECVAWFTSALTPTHEVASADTFEEGLVRVKGGDFDLIVVSLGMRVFDGLRLCSQLRSLPEGRHVPILVVVSDGDRRKLTQALEMGVNDYLTRPVDKNELVAHVRTQLRKKRYADRLRHNVQLSLEMAITDQLTGLHNRR